MAITSVYATDASQPAYDPNSPAALEAKAKYEGYTKDGQALQTSDLYNELERLDEVKKSRIALLTKPEEIAAAFFVTTDDDMRAISYSKVLQERGESGDAYASFFYGVRQWNYCSLIQRQQEEVWIKRARECWQGVMASFKRASDAQIAAAAFNIAMLYENGFGVSPSKLAAAEWYVKSANQYNKDKSREDALTSVERALSLVPDHPAALRLRKAMLK
jgi:tetratricopeptide (TPR) repeat protein